MILSRPPRRARCPSSVRRRANPDSAGRVRDETPPGDGGSWSKWRRLILAPTSSAVPRVPSSSLRPSKKATAASSCRRLGRPRRLISRRPCPIAKLVRFRGFVVSGGLNARSPALRALRPQPRRLRLRLRLGRVLERVEARQAVFLGTAHRASEIVGPPRVLLPPPRQRVALDANHDLDAVVRVFLRREPVQAKQPVVIRARRRTRRGAARRRAPSARFEPRRRRTRKTTEKPPLLRRKPPLLRRLFF